jgi:hypothetical protein
VGPQVTAYGERIRRGRELYCNFGRLRRCARGIPDHGEDGQPKGIHDKKGPVFIK